MSSQAVSPPLFLSPATGFCALHDSGRSGQKASIHCIGSYRLQTLFFYHNVLLRAVVWSVLKSEAAAWPHWALARLAMSRPHCANAPLGAHARQVHPAFRLIVCGETPEPLGKAVPLIGCHELMLKPQVGTISRLDRRGGLAHADIEAAGLELSWQVGTLFHFHAVAALPSHEQSSSWSLSARP